MLYCFDIVEFLFTDLAISAPWGGDDGNGVVYIYNVRAGNVVTTPSQVRII